MGRRTLMELCSGPRNARHDEVCYEAADCPACEIRDELQKEIGLLERKLEEALNAEWSSQ